MSRLLDDGATRAWLLLVGLTLVSWLAVESHLAGGVGVSLAIMVAGFKMRLIAAHFMDVRGAGDALRRTFDGWAILCVVMILAVYWTTA